VSLLVHTKGTSIRVILKVTHTKDQHPYKELGTQHEMTHSSLFVNSFLQPNFNSHGSLDLLLFQNNGCIRELSVDSPCLWSLVFSLNPLSPSNWSPKINGGVGGGGRWGFGELSRLNIFCCWAKTKEWMGPVGCVTIDLLWHFCTNYVFKWQSSIRRFSHMNHICMSKKIKYPFMFLFCYLEGTLWFFFFPLNFGYEA